MSLADICATHKSRKSLLLIGGGVLGMLLISPLALFAPRDPRQSPLLPRLAEARSLDPPVCRQAHQLQAANTTWTQYWRAEASAGLIALRRPKYLHSNLCRRECIPVLAQADASFAIRSDVSFQTK